VINYHKILTGNSKYYDIGLLVLRFLPSYYMIVNHGWKKITNPEKWERYGTFLTKYFGDFLDFLNVPLGFMAAFSESVCITSRAQVAQKAHGYIFQYIFQ
jgi:hypothetical protein